MGPVYCHGYGVLKLSQLLTTLPGTWLYLQRPIGEQFVLFNFIFWDERRPCTEMKKGKLASQGTIMLVVCSCQGEDLGYPK